ncbi:hypothetical protein ACPA9J_11605 [Pseudomonas aeruginosa]
MPSPPCLSSCCGSIFPDDRSVRRGAGLQSLFFPSLRRRSLPKLIVLLGVLRGVPPAPAVGQSLRLTHLHRAGWLLPEDEWEELLDFLEKEQFVCRAGGGEWVLCRDLGAYSLHRAC